MSKLKIMAAAIAVVPVFALSSHAFATTLSQFEGGDIYYGRNVSQNQAFALGDTTATCGDTVQLRVRIHNPGPDATIPNVHVVATLPSAAATSFTSTVTVSSPYADPNSVSDTTTVKSDKTATLSYINGTTQLVAAHGDTVLSTLPDGITSSGVNLPDPIGVSVDNKRYVQFEAKLNCPVAPQPIQVCRLADKQIVTIDEKDFDSSKYSKDLSKCAPTPPQPITVCRLSDKKIVTIDQKDFDSTKYSKDLTKCAPTPPAPHQITVCELATKKVVNIDENAFDSTKYSKDLTQCNTTPPPVTPPTTLVNTGAGSVAGIAAVVAAVSAIGYRVVLSRRAARQ